MILKKKMTKEVEVTEDIFCNKCGESCREDTLPEDVAGFYGLIEARVTGGYFSPALEDMTCYDFSLCEKCLKQLFDDFRIPVQKTEYIL